MQALIARRVALHWNWGCLQPGVLASPARMGDGELTVPGFETNPHRLYRCTFGRFYHETGDCPRVIQGVGSVAETSNP